jgi:hypothetical protein
MTSAPDVRTALAGTVARIKKVAARLAAGKTLTDDELRVIGAAPPAPAPAMVYDSYSAAASALGVTKSLIQRLKREGAPGFRGSRVYASELLPYLRARESLAIKNGEGETKESLEIRRLRATCERIEDRLARERGQFVAVVDLSTHLRKFAAEVKRLLRQKESEFPALVAGLTAPQVKVFFQTTISDSILKALETHFSTWTI